MRMRGRKGVGFGGRKIRLEISEGGWWGFFSEREEEEVVCVVVLVSRVVGIGREAAVGVFLSFPFSFFVLSPPLHYITAASVLVALDVFDL